MQHFYYSRAGNQKGSIENGNGVIRAELPRNCDAKQLMQQNVDNIINNINNRPFEEFQKCIDLS